MKKNNMPLNLRERINSRISLLCSVIILVLLVLVMHQMDYTLIRKPQKEAAEAAALKEQQLVRGLNMTPQEFAAFVRGGALQAAPAPIPDFEQEDSAHEEI